MLKTWPEHDLNMQLILNHAHLDLMRSLLSLVIPLDGSVQDVCCNGDRLCKGELALAIVLGKHARKSSTKGFSESTLWYWRFGVGSCSSSWSESLPPQPPSTSRCGVFFFGPLDVRRLLHEMQPWGQADLRRLPPSPPSRRRHLETLCWRRSA